MSWKKQIPFHRDHSNTFTIFYDVEEEAFYRSYIGRQKYYNPFSGVMTTLTYPVVSSVTFSLFAVLPVIAIGMSFLLAVLFYWLTIVIVQRQWKKQRADIVYFPITSRDRLQQLISEGRQDLQKIRWMIISLFIVNIVITFALLATPESMLLFVTHTLFWWALFVLIGVAKFRKRKKLYNDMEEKLPEMAL